MTGRTDAHPHVMTDPGEPLWLKIKKEFGLVPAARKLCAVQLSEAGALPFQYEPPQDSKGEPKLLIEVAIPVAGSVRLPLNVGLLSVPVTDRLPFTVSGYIRPPINVR